MSKPALSAGQAGARSSIPVKDAPPGWAFGLAGLAIVLAGCVAYSNSFNGRFTFDDEPSILHNPTIRHGLWAALQAPMGTKTVSGRPLVNLSVALNYQLGGFQVWGYHAFNLAIQLLAGLTLFGLVRRTLERPGLRSRHGAAALPLAFLSALLWTVHPLQTESVTFIIQRAESMMGLFYLLTMYFFALGLESKRAGVWQGLSVLACLAGMLTKETMATAPLLVLLYDRTFGAGTFAGAWRQRWKYYAVLACTWVPLAWIVVGVSLPGNASVPNLSMEGLGPMMKSYAYALKQCEAIVHYVSLSFWPHPLIFAYLNNVVTNPLDVAPQIVALALLLGGTIFALWRQPALGFLGAWFFVILAPTSSVVPVHGQTMSEHHLYLSLAALMVLAAAGLRAGLGRRSWIAGLALALALGGLTFERNRDYLTQVSLWADTLEKSPTDVRLRTNMGIAFDDADRRTEAMASYQESLRVNPADATAENNLGADLNTLGRPQEALPHLLRSLALEPVVPDVNYNLGKSYLLLKQTDQAQAAFLKALEIDPDYAVAHCCLGDIYLLDQGRIEQAITEYQTALNDDPDLAAAESGLGNAYMQAKRPAEAIPHLANVVRLKPDLGDAYRGLGDAYVAAGRFSDAIAPYETAVRLLPQDAGTCNNLGVALFQLHRLDEAAQQFQEALRRDPTYSNARANLEKIRQLTQAPGGQKQ